MSSAETINEEKRLLSYERQNAVRTAWKQEKARIIEGNGTRDWSVAEQKELLEQGSVSGYEGHHMKSVALFPAFAGDPDNIQFLTEEEHLVGAHKGSFHNPTNGYYDPKTKKMCPFRGKELKPPPVKELSKCYPLSEDSLSKARAIYWNMAIDDKEKTASTNENIEINDQDNYYNSHSNTHIRKR